MFHGYVSLPEGNATPLFADHFPTGFPRGFSRSLYMFTPGYMNHEYVIDIPFMSPHTTIVVGFNPNFCW